MTAMNVHSYQNVSLNGTATFSDLLTTMNSSGAGWLFTGINFMLFFILLITFTMSTSLEVALLTSGFISFIIGLLFAYMGVMSWHWLGVFVGAMVVGIMMRIYNRNG